MPKRLFLLDGMALVYRAHFALVARPIFTSKGINTSALYGFTQTLLDILRNQQPTHLAVAFDTDAPTQRHAAFPDYKATRESMPEDLSQALPSVRRMLDAFRIPVLTCDGYEADDLIGTLVQHAERTGFTSYMVTPDKDFAQLVTPNTLIYKPGRMGDAAEVLGVNQIKARWGIEDPAQVIDILALMGDASDNIPGVPGIGEKTAIKLVSQFGSVENLIARSAELKGKTRELIETHQAVARMSRELATIIRNAPCDCDIETLKLRTPDEPALKAILVEFEFNSIGKRLFGDDFTSGRGFRNAVEPATAPEIPASPVETQPQGVRGAVLKKLADVPHDYRVLAPEHDSEVIAGLLRQKTLAIKTALLGEDPKQARLLGVAVSQQAGQAFFFALENLNPQQLQAPRQRLSSLLHSPQIEKVGHDLKSDALALKWHDLRLAGPLFDCMVAHSLAEPDLRHSLDYLGEAFLGYSPMPRTAEQAELLPASAGTPDYATRAMEAADLAMRLRPAMETLIDQKSQRRVFAEIELPLIQTLADMEYEGIRLDAPAMARFASELERELESLEKNICRLAGTTFNLNSPKQLGTILFDTLRICDAPKKTRTGQYVTDEQTLSTLAPDHEIVRLLLDYRTASKLKSTYADALPTAIWPRTGRIHTTYHQVATSTGRLNSQNPNLQNIPIRTERGQEIRKAFVPRSADYLLLSADYSQIELRIIAALSHETGLLEAFRTGADVHTSTAARVFGVFPDLVTPEMRRKAKMVNYGIAYGISAFGLAQRLAIPRKEAAEIIDLYFKQFPGIARYMEQTVAFARQHGYVETVTGRRRYIRDINSSNATVRGGAERNAINAPIQGTAADMIKIAMVNIHRELESRGLLSRLLLQVHDELVLDLYRPEEKSVIQIVEDKMKTAIPLDVPIEVESGVGANWLEAH